MKIKQGGALSNLKSKEKLKELTIYHNDKRTFYLTLNGDCLSYVTLDELLDLRDEINVALKKVLNPSEKEF